MSQIYAFIIIFFSVGRLPVTSGYLQWQAQQDLKNAFT
jgi:hypothetical protein